MATIFDNLVFDRVLGAVFEDADNNILGGLNQIQNFTVDTSSTTKDKTDANGVLIKRIYTAKNVEVSGENAVYSLDLSALQFGSSKEVASAEGKIQLPRIYQLTVADGVTEIDLKDVPVEGTLSICALTSYGTPDITKQYTQGAEATETAFVLSDKKVTLPTGLTGKIQIKYDYETENAVKVTQYSDKFPEECKATFSILAYDVCDKTTLRHLYLVFPAFQMSPDHSISFNTEDTQSFSGTAAADYCAEKGKELYYIALSEDDTEE